MNAELRRATADPQTKPNDLGCKSACKLPESTCTIAIYYHYSARKLILILLSHGGKGLSRPGWLITYRDGLPARRRSPIWVLTGSDVAQLRSSKPTRHHYAKPTIKCWYSRALRQYIVTPALQLVGLHVHIDCAVVRGNTAENVRFRDFVFGKVKIGWNSRSGSSRVTTDVANRKVGWEFLLAMWCISTLPQSVHRCYNKRSK